MEIHSKYAVIGYCPDLTDPKAQSVPLAIVAVGEGGAGQGFVLSITSVSQQLAIPELQRDVYSAKMLSDFQGFLHTQIKASLRVPNTSSLLTELNKRLRHTIHIESIKDFTFNSQEEQNLAPEAMRAFAHIFDQEIVHITTASSSATASKMENKHGLDMSPDISFRTITSLAHSVEA